MNISIDGKDKLCHKLLDNASMLIFFINSEGNIVISNKMMEAITSKSKEDILGKNWLNVLYRDSNTPIKQQMFRAVMENTMTYKRANNFQEVIVDDHNGEKIISWSITPILSESQDLEGVLFAGNDITDLRKREESLKKIDDTLKNIFSSIKDYALYVTNLDGNITYYGMGAEAMFGWQKNEIIFQNLSLLYPEEVLKSKLPFLLEQVRQKGKYELEIDMLKKDKQSLPVILSVNQFLDIEGKLSGYIFIAKDITEKKKLEYQIFQAEKLAAIGQLVAGIAHEINNPLFVISGRLELLLSKKRLAGKEREALDIINSQASRIRNLVDRFLRFSRKGILKIEVINLNEAIDNVLPLLAYHNLHTCKINIEKDLEKNLPLIKGDLNQLQEVFINLLLNAYQAMPEGGSIRITTAKISERFLEIRISDTGSGITQGNLKNLFMPFFTTKKEGTGLGLSICYNIIKNHEGSIDIETQVNEGTTFFIRLPFIQ
ncbi:PAS domain-containing sensor histidine kinase [bacterium]|nr:MAG: PAS domain-containing sensor histidine kinase [bacterium]